MPERFRVFDTVVLSNFLLSSSAYILEKRYGGNGIITTAVYDELSAGRRQFRSLAYIDELLTAKTFTLCSLSTVEHDYYKEMIHFLGRGEASCIALAKGRGWIVVTDDRAARRQCTTGKIAVTGTIGILKASVIDNLLSLEEADKVLAAMVKAGFYSPVKALSDIL